MAVRGPGEGGVVVSDVIPDRRPRLICQHDVISSEAFLDNEGRGGDVDPMATESEEEDGTVLG